MLNAEHEADLVDARGLRQQADLVELEVEEAEAVLNGAGGYEDGGSGGLLETELAHVVSEQRVLLAEDAVFGQQSRAVFQLCPEPLLVDCLHLVLPLLASGHADDVSLVPHAFREEVHHIAHLCVLVQAAFRVLLPEGLPPLLELRLFLLPEAGSDPLHDIADELGLAEGGVVEVLAAERAGGLVFECFFEAGQAEGVAAVREDRLDHEFQADWTVELFRPCDGDVLLAAEIHSLCLLWLFFLAPHPPSHSLPQLLPTDTGPRHKRPLLLLRGLQLQGRQR